MAELTGLLLKVGGAVLLRFDEEDDEWRDEITESLEASDSSRDLFRLSSREL